MTGHIAINMKWLNKKLLISEGKNGELLFSTFKGAEVIVMC